MYTVDYFIKKFEAIPEGNWCVDVCEDSVGRRCAIGHLNAHINNCNEEFSVFNSMMKKHRTYGSDVNNGRDIRYQQPTPKQRILAALYDVKAMQQPVHEDITASLAVLPVSETSDVITKPVLS